MNNGKHGQGTHCTKMGADSLAENTPNSHNLSAQFVCPSPKVLDLNEKRLHWASVVQFQFWLAKHVLQKVSNTIQAYVGFFFAMG